MEVVNISEIQGISREYIDNNRNNNSNKTKRKTEQGGSPEAAKQKPENMLTISFYEECSKIFITICIFNWNIYVIFFNAVFCLLIFLRNYIVSQSICRLSLMLFAIKTTIISSES